MPQQEEARAAVQNQNGHPDDGGQLEEGQAHVPEGGSGQHHFTRSANCHKRSSAGVSLMQEGEEMIPSLGSDEYA